MNEILSDLKYLLSLKRNCSFGTTDIFSSPVKQSRVFGSDITNITPYTPQTPYTLKTPQAVKPIDTNVIYELCGNDFHMYSYPSYTRGKNMIMNTPGFVNTTESTAFEGPHHPICKIENEYYKDYIITEDFVKYKGTDEVIDKYYNCEGECDPVLILGIILTCYFSLNERLRFYINILEKDGKIDEGHSMAPFSTMKRIKQLLNKLKSNDKYYNCAVEFLKHEPPNLPKLRIIYKSIEDFSQNPSEDDLLRYIYDLYYKVLVPGGRFSMIPKLKLKSDKIIRSTPIKAKKLIF